MNNYELTFLVEDPKDAEKVKKIITALKGKISDEKHWGKLDFAYEIKDLTSADYYTWVIKMDTTQMAELKQKLNFEEDVIRFLLLKNDE